MKRIAKQPVPQYLNQNFTLTPECFDCFYPNGGQINRNNAFGEYYVDDHVSF